MFGYITADKRELKVKDLNRYRAYYCGLCHDLGKNGGQLSRMTLTYDMTFLALLLSGLYEGKKEIKEESCILHPFKKRYCIHNAYTSYAADMNLLLVYHNLEDDWIDEKNVKSYAASRSLRPAYLRTAAKYPRQVKAIRHYLKRLHEAERQGNPSVDAASGMTGELMAEIYAMKDDVWQDDLRKIGFYMGKFIYLMDAWDDLEKDKENGLYNPFTYLSDEVDADEQIRGILLQMASSAAMVFERLPILENVDILRNILYSGIWIKYREKNNTQKEEKNVRSI